MSKVVHLRFAEPVGIDGDRLRSLTSSLGRDHAAEVGLTAADEIALRLADLDAAWTAGNTGRLARVARSLVGISSELGLARLASVAQALSDLPPAAADPTRGALVARVIRLGGASLSAVMGSGLLRG